jgi:hypothetical protein
MRGLTFIGAVSILFLLPPSASRVLAQTRSLDSVKAMERAAPQIPDSTLKKKDHGTQRSDSTAASKPVVRSSTIRTLGRETAPHASKNVGKVKNNQPTTR